ncbi:unnamed protein product [Orchesella dallaii]|uniref:Inactive ubiquitin carboxyl-terminal hydrolase 53 n=1 Tax=Orchesella dallaii TaxID=48710 RepID=A0ABP1QG73_9HEXA
MMESPLVELTRSLYHLDYFRRNFRKLPWHECGANGVNCLVCSFKNLFHELSLLMRESVLDPPHIRQTIESSIENAKFGKFPTVASVPTNLPVHIQFETLLRELEESSISSSVSYDPSVFQNLNLHTEFSYTKICLHCRTTTYVENVTQYVMQIDAGNFVSDDWPSFEFAIKTSLDSGEFCAQPNCHGQTKVFRLLRSVPHFLPMCFSDSSSVSLISFIPSRLRPHLIFESSTSVADLSLKGLILHSPQWGYATIFHHSRLDLWVFIDSRRVLTLCKSWMESRFHPIVQGFTVLFCFYCRDDNACIPSLPSRSRIYDAPPQRNEKLEYESTRIYENWPLDTDSGVSSELSSNNSSVCYPSTSSKPSNRDSVYSNSSEQPRHSPTKSPSIRSNDGSELKYATVRRKVGYHGKRVKGNLASLSMSAPDLRVLVPPAAICPVVPAVALSPALVKTSRHSDDSSVSSKDTTHKKVSFNCEVTLVDDPDDEYIPHPILQSILQKLNKS